MHPRAGSAAFAAAMVILSSGCAADEPARDASSSGASTRATPVFGYSPDDQDDRTLHVVYAAPGDPACGHLASATARESPTEVVVDVRLTTAEGDCNDVGLQATASITLTDPVGTRAVVGLAGEEIPRQP